MKSICGMSWQINDMLGRIVLFQCWKCCADFIMYGLSSVDKSISKSHARVTASGVLYAKNYASLWDVVLHSQRQTPWRVQHTVDCYPRICLANHMCPCTMQGGFMYAETLTENIMLLTWATEFCGRNFQLLPSRALTRQRYNTHKHSSIVRRYCITVLFGVARHERAVLGWRWDAVADGWVLSVCGRLGLFGLSELCSVRVWNMYCIYS